MKRADRKQGESAMAALASIGDRPMHQASKPPRRIVRDPLTKLMRKRGWNYQKGYNSVRRRLYDLVSERRQWWDWGHPLMILTGTDDGGNWSEPEPPTWWYRFGEPKRMARTGYPRHPLSTIQVVKDYETFRALTDGLNEDEMYKWKAICVNQDGALHLGHQYWGKQFFDLNKYEVALLRRYLRMWRRLDWFGLRSWLYHQGLHAAVHRRKPRSCQAVPPRGTGGYSHWHCQEKRRHKGDHRFNNYTWADTATPVEYAGRAS